MLFAISGSMIKWVHLFPMLSARRKSDGQTVTAYFEFPGRGPYHCIVCNDEVILKTGRHRVNHFAHVNPLQCQFLENESDEHRKCKMEIYEALLREPGAEDVVLERPIGPVRPDVSAVINGIKVAIEVQISSLSLETITHRTIQYAQKGIYVLWLLPWTSKLDAKTYNPKLWEKWVHAAYFGRVYYWLTGLTVVSYHFDPKLKAVPKTTWYSKDGKKMIAGGFSRRMTRFRTPIRGKHLHLARDFGPRLREWWEGGGLKVPDAKLFMEQ